MIVVANPITNLNTTCDQRSATANSVARRRLRLTFGSWWWVRLEAASWDANGAHPLN